jgi:hypothetical protein
VKAGVAGRVPAKKEKNEKRMSLSHQFEQARQGNVPRENRRRARENMSILGRLDTGGEAARSVVVAHQQERKEEEEANRRGTLQVMSEGGFEVQAEEILQEFMKAINILPTDEIVEEENGEQAAGNKATKKRKARSPALASIVFGFERILQLQESGGELDCSLLPLGGQPAGQPHRLNKRVAIGSRGDLSNVNRHLKRYHMPLVAVLKKAKRQGVLFSTAEELQLGGRLLELYGVCGTVEQSEANKRRRLTRQLTIDGFVRNPTMVAFEKLKESRAKDVSLVAQSIYFARHHIGYAAADDPFWSSRSLPMDWIPTLLFLEQRIGTSGCRCLRALWKNGSRIYLKACRQYV